MTHDAPTLLSESEKSLILEAASSDPFTLLGMHQLGAAHEGRLEVRVHLPAAGRAWMIPESGDAVEMHPVAGTGLFVWQSRPEAEPFPYLIRMEYEDGSVSSDLPDTYALEPILGELDLHLISEGRHERLFDCLGAHHRTVVMRKGGGETRGYGGVLFAVWAPDAAQVSVIGSWNAWDRRVHPMRSRGGSGVWELFVPGIGPGEHYKYSITTRSGEVLEKADPLAFGSELRPRTASVVVDTESFEWSDSQWMRERSRRDPLAAPMSIYEVHLSSWKRPWDDRGFHSWDEISTELVPYIGDMGFTHVELLPVLEHPLDDSWGYQSTGYFSPTARHGEPQGFQRFVDLCHRSGIGVILDWTPAHFPEDAFALAGFDGTCLYEHEDPRLGRHPDWGSLVFNYGRNEVRNFLVASALFWLDRYHLDGIRVDAVASMLYLDYSRKDGEWVPNIYGGRENLGAIEFLRELNEKVHGQFPGVVMIAEESTAWPGVSRPTYLGGLGFTFKWNMGWMHDTLRFLAMDPVHRKYHMNDITFGLLYSWTENFVLPLSHDEVVHGKGSLSSRMPGDEWQKLANLRLLLCLQWTYPGKQMLFMGGELGQWAEWDHSSQLPGELLSTPQHSGVQSLVRDLNRLYRESPELHVTDCSPEGFSWIDFSDFEQTVVSYRRRSGDGEMVCVFNLTPVPRQRYRIGVPESGQYRELINSDSTYYGGSGIGNLGMVSSQNISWHGLDFSLELDLPPLAAVLLRRESSR